VKETVLAQPHMRKQRLLPVVSPDGIILGLITWQDVMKKALEGNITGTVDDLMIKDIITTYPEESLRTIADRMAAHQVGVLPVIDKKVKGKLCGLITQFDLLTARDRILQEERKRERVLKLWSVYRYGNFSGITNIFSSQHEHDIHHSHDTDKK
jgi:CBS-domain-containing membrane protein